jgi:hypothetical protein
LRQVKNLCDFQLILKEISSFSSESQKCRFRA